ncbi:Elongation factor Ts, mitochondrial, partial [Stegodyphus mimosarum]
MFGLLSRRFFHASCANMSSVTSSALSKLRKSTGYSISNCRKALELFDDDISKAEEWLHAEAKQKGWSKWAKIQSRSAEQGLIGVFTKNSVGVMVEVNCETDFVARNAEFQLFVENVLSGCINHITTYASDKDITKAVLNEMQLNELKCHSGTVGELVASAINKFNEKTVTKRAVCFKVKDNIHLNSLSHPSTACPNIPGATLGKYGALLAFSKDNMKSDTNLNELGLNLCQHIIGMNPTTLGQMTEQDLLSLKSTQHIQGDCSKTEKEDSQSNGSVETSEDKTDEEADSQYVSNMKDSNETRMLYQPYLLDSSMTVGEILYNSGIELLHFERYECGESQAENVETADCASA